MVKMLVKMLTQVEIEDRLIRYLEALENATAEFEGLCVAAGVAEAEVKGAWARAYLSMNGPVRQREALADLECDELEKEHKIADARMKATREHLTSLRTAIDALRTLNANVRVQV